MASGDRQPVFLIRDKALLEFKFRETKSEMLNWFYHLLAIDFRLEKNRVEPVIALLNAWDTKKDYEFSLLQEIDRLFYDHPLLAMAFNVLVDSKNTFIRLKVPFTSTNLLNYFKKNYNNVSKLEDNALTQLYLTQEVEKTAVRETRFGKVLIKLLEQEPPPKITVGDGSVAIYCQKLVVFYGFSQYWGNLINCMAYYLNKKARAISRDSKPTTSTENEPEGGENMDIAPPNPKIPKFDESNDEESNDEESNDEESNNEESNDEFPEFERNDWNERPKKTLTPEQRLISSMCNMLKMDNKNLLLELKYHVWQLDAIANEVLKLASHPSASHQ